MKFCKFKTRSAANEAVIESQSKLNDNKIVNFLESAQDKIFSLKNKYLIFCFLVPVAIMYILYLAMEIHPFGNGSVLVLDLNGQYVYFFESLRNTVYGEGSFLYTFFRALGGEYMGMYAYYLASPLSYIICLFPQDRILEALLTIILLKVGLCGTTFGYYLHRSSKAPNKFMVIAFSVMYSLCAYAVVHQNNIMWIDALIWLPLLTLGIEQLIKFSKFKLFVISLALTIMSNYYIGYMVCIYTVAYFFYYLLANDPAVKNPLGEKHHTLKSCFKLGFFSVLAAAISAFIIMAAYYSLTFGKTDFSNPSWAITAKFDILDFFTKLLPGSYDTVRPEGLPFVYCGVLALFMIPVYFVSKSISSREKLASFGLIGFFVFSFILKPLDLIWHGFSAPNWLNYRYSFMLCFFMLVISYKGLGNLKKVGEKFLFGIAMCIILFVSIAEKMEFETYVETEKKLDTFAVVWLSVIVTIVLLGALFAFMRAHKKAAKIGVSSVLLGVICLEIFASSLICMFMFDGDVVYSSYSGYNNYLKGIRPIVEEIKEEDDSFYRMETLDHRKYNDNMALAMRGLTNSTSTLNSDTIAFLGKMGYVSRSHLSKYLGGNPVNDSLLGVKYVIEKTAKTDTEKAKQTPLDRTSTFYEEKFENGSYKGYLNPYALSVAYEVDKDLLNFDFDAYPTYFEGLNALVSAMNGNDEIVPIFVPEEKATRSMSGVESQRTSEKTTYFVKEDSTGIITFRFIASYSGDYYIHVPSNNYKEVEISVNGAEASDDWLGSNTRHMYPLGHFEKSTSVKVELKLAAEYVSILNDLNYVWYIDEEAFKSEFEKLAEGPQLTIDENYKEDNLTGSITTTEADQTILTTIPYDKGWQVYIDGEKIDTYEALNALVAFDIDEVGEHSVQIKYMPSIYKWSLVVSVIGIAVFIALCCADYIVKKKQKAEGILSSDAEEIKWTLEDFDESQEDEAEKAEEIIEENAESESIPDNSKNVTEISEETNDQGEN
ncbi:MAG: YfhO family protein [Clostridia bacterium]|nr:YfhO family protein [Clostridia bacterium]